MRVPCSADALRLGTLLEDVTAGGAASTLDDTASCDLQAEVRGIATDSRSIEAGDVFFALVGERVDGHAFVGRALGEGAHAAVVSEERLASLPAELHARCIAVDDPLAALERLAVGTRERLGFSVTAITGSVGKTTTKEFLATILSQRFRVEKAPRSFNNRLGVALTLLHADSETEHMVLEMGTSAAGEISWLSRLARPERIAITAVAPAHLSGLRDMDGVVAAKAEILDGLAIGGRVFLNRGLYAYGRFAQRAREVGGEVCAWGFGAGAEYPLERVRLQSDGWSFEVSGEAYEIRVPGRHNVENACAAIALALDSGLTPEEIRCGLSQCRLPPGRLEVREKNGFVLLDDSYNANPRSMCAAFDELGSGLGASFGDCGTGRRIAVLGDMLELGSSSEPLHREVGRTLAAQPIDLLVTVGEQSRHIGEAYREALERSGEQAPVGGRHFGDASSAYEFLTGELVRGDRILFKGSNRVGVGQLARRVEEWTELAHRVATDTRCAATDAG